MLECPEDCKRVSACQLNLPVIVTTQNILLTIPDTSYWDDTLALLRTNGLLVLARLQHLSLHFDLAPCHFRVPAWQEVPGY